MKLIKFGGTSLGNVNCINRVIAIIMRLRQEHDLAVVVSAVGDTTEELIEMRRLATRSEDQYVGLFQNLREKHLTIIRELIGSDAEVSHEVKTMFAELQDILKGIFLVRDCSNKLSDAVLSFGERMSAIIVAGALQQRGIPAEYLDASRVLKTDDRFGTANVRHDATRREIRSYFDGRRSIQVITGFIGSCGRKEITTLGRGGSDYSAAIFGEALGCSEIQIWTDVNGVMTADPKLVPDAFPIERMCYQEAIEMAYYGSRIIHPKAIQLAASAGIPITIKNTFDPDFNGTRICDEANSRETEVRESEVHGIASLSDVSLLRVRGNGQVGLAELSSRLFPILARANIEVIFSRQSFSRKLLSLVMLPHLVDLAAKCIKQEFGTEMRANPFARIDIREDIAVIAVISQHGPKSDITARILRALNENSIEVIELFQNSPDISTLVLVNTKDEAAAVNAIHDSLSLGFDRTLNLFLIGPGAVGSKLLEQIAKRNHAIKNQGDIEIKINAIANSSRMIYDRHGLPPDNWLAFLKNAEEPSDLDKFLEIAKAHCSNSKVVVDCTASDMVAARYDGILQSGISIVTPNKLAASGKYRQYQRLKHLAHKGKARFFYETNVGASLPIISTMRDMVLCGDEILRIEAVISGTVSFLFNAFDGSKTFSEMVRAAHRHGYMEPDPREDLAGQDVARKLIIMAREAGFKLELAEVAVESLLPDACHNGKSTEEFFEQLKTMDAYFEKRRCQAGRQGKVLRYIASFENNEAKVALRAVGKEHPFSTLNGNDNIVVLKTRRYFDSPLVIRGPGAGADVTAAGVFADILRVIN
ncbi:bifunctional aspartate kinase/homoserine dehydrogenase I [bacterium]|nr:bifunctional aspartate kinase/homoserine dehydrogenase I [bacterium]